MVLATLAYHKCDNCHVPIIVQIMLLSVIQLSHISLDL